jgi:hypothetical protein
MTRKERSERMKQAWVRRRANALKPDPEVAAMTISRAPSTATAELKWMRTVVTLLEKLSPAGRQYVINRFR